jgi:hypothetical protein
MLSALVDAVVGFVAMAVLDAGGADAVAVLELPIAAELDAWWRFFDFEDAHHRAPVGKRKKARPHVWQSLHS